MFQTQKFLRPGILLAAVWLAACAAEAPRRPGGGTGGSGNDDGEGGEGGTGNTAGRGGRGGGGGGRGGTGGAGGNNGTGGTGGSASQVDAAPSVVMDAAPSGGDVAPAGDLGPDVPHSPIPGYAVCLPCHGPEGAGTMLGPDIQHPVVDFGTWMVRNGRMHPAYKDPMPKFTEAQLSAAQLQGIFTFLAGQPKPTTGQGLFKDFCANCHGADAKGGPVMHSLLNEPMNAFITNVRSGHHAGEFTNRREYMPKWTAAELSDAEIRSIAMYVDTL